MIQRLPFVILLSITVTQPSVPVLMIDVMLFFCVVKSHLYFFFFNSNQVAKQMSTWLHEPSKV